MPTVPVVSSAQSQADLSLKSNSASEKSVSAERRDSRADVPEISQSERSKKQYNAAILQANYDVSITTKNQPQALVYKAAIDAINKELESELGPNAIQEGYDSGLDVSPEATASRIVSMTTGMFSLYQESNPELSFKEQVNRFIEIVKSGVDQGFGEAREILDGLGVLEGEIEQNIDSTYELVQKGLDAFRERQLNLEADNESNTNLANKEINEDL